MPAGATTLAEIQSADWSLMLDSTAALLGIVTSPAPVLVPSPGETAALFDGSTGYVSVPTVTRLTSGVTLECWVKLPATGAKGCFISIGSAGYQLWLGDSIDPSNQLSANYDDSSSVAPGPLLSTGVWHHVAFVIGDPLAPIYYVDGVAYPTTANVGPMAPGFFGDVATLGCDQLLSGTPYRPSNCEIARAAVYTSALSPAQIAAHASASHDTDYDAAVLADSPVAFWKLDEASGTVAADSSGNGNTGTYQGAVTLGETGPLLVMVLGPAPAGGAGIGNVVQGLADVDQCIRIICTTPPGTDPLRPTFAADVFKFIDMPINIATAHIVRELTDAITQWEPRVKVLSISVQPILTGAQAGAQVQAIITWQLKLANGASLSAAQQTIVTLAAAVS